MKIWKWRFWPGLCRIREEQVGPPRFAFQVENGQRSSAEANDFVFNAIKSFEQRFIHNQISIYDFISIYNTVLLLGISKIFVVLLVLLRLL